MNKVQPTEPPSLRPPKFSSNKKPAQKLSTPPKPQPAKEIEKQSTPDFKAKSPEKDFDQKKKGAKKEEDLMNLKSPLEK